MAKGKLMNPADKARKEARKKELKKNKKQRQQVRSTIIEEKDPDQIIADLEKLDKLEFDITSYSSVNENIMKDKRKKLKDIFDKIMLYYARENPDKHANLKKIYSQYETNHQKTFREFQAIKAALEVELDEIFLPPEETQDTATCFEIADDDPLLSETVYVTHLNEGVKPPGCPPGPPPDLNDLVKEIISKSNEQQLKLVQSVVDTHHPVSTPASSTRPSWRPTRRVESFRNDTPRKNHEQVSEPSKITTKTEAVIESKPVIFKPRSTQFIPVAVQLKMKKTSKQADD